MPRTKGSKNKPKTATADFAFQIVEKSPRGKHFLLKSHPLLPMLIL